MMLRERRVEMILRRRHVDALRAGGRTAFVQGAGIGLAGWLVIDTLDALLRFAQEYAVCPPALLIVGEGAALTTRLGDSARAAARCAASLEAAA